MQELRNLRELAEAQLTSFHNIQPRGGLVVVTGAVTAPLIQKHQVLICPIPTRTPDEVMGLCTESSWNFR